MSADEFDSDIERLFARAPHMPDAALFTAQVETQLHRGGQMRFAALSIAGLVGGIVAVRETFRADLGLASERGGVVLGDALGDGLRGASASTSGWVQSFVDQAGLGGLEMGSMSGMQMFWIAAGALIALAAAGVMKLSQDA